jgi:hypothetical protein
LILGGPSYLIDLIYLVVPLPFSAVVLTFCGQNPRTKQCSSVDFPKGCRGKSYSPEKFNQPYDQLLIPNEPGGFLTWRFPDESP